jgi:hypothetical protein
LKDDQPLLGSWFLRIDRFGDVHMVAAQNKGQTCALASIKMVYFKVNKLRPGVSSFTLERALEQKYQGLAKEKSHDWERFGVPSPDVPTQVLNSLGLGSWKTTYPSPGQVGTKIAHYVGTDQFGLGITGINAIRRRAPVILWCVWPAHGGHVVVVDTVTHIPLVGTFATICDPWDANVHFERIEDGKSFTYHPGKAPGFNFWGHTQNEKHNSYSAAHSTGTVIAITHQV